MLASWAEAVGVPRSALLELRRPQDRAVALAKAIGSRRMLLIADGCEDAADAALFNLAGPNCAHLLTTACAAAASVFAGSNVTHLGFLTEEEGIEVIEKFAPSLTGERSGTRRLVRMLNGVPAQVAMFARMLGSVPADARQMLEALTSAAKEPA